MGNIDPITDPRHALRRIVDMIDRDAPREELRAAVDEITDAWAMPRTVSTADELDALPDGSVIAADGHAWQRAWDGWLSCDGDAPVPSFDVADRADRFTVLREGWLG